MVVAALAVAILRARAMGSVPVGAVRVTLLPVIAVLAPLAVLAPVALG